MTFAIVYFLIGILFTVFLTIFHKLTNYEYWTLETCPEASLFCWPVCFSVLIGIYLPCALCYLIKFSICKYKNN